MKAIIFILSRIRLFIFSSVACALLLSGCGSTRYRADYNGFNAAYADSSNHQMLLNLARLDQHDPTYFLQFGQISVQYQLSSSLNVQAADSVPQSTFHVPFVTGMGTVAAGATTTPQFTFIPVTDDKVAQQLLLPLPPEDLYTLFQQGVPVDQLLRLMAERFEIQIPGESKVTTFSNNPGRCSNVSYIIFLKICAIARELQLAGVLKLRTEDKYIPFSPGWTWSPTKTAGGSGGAGAKGGGDSSGGDDTESDTPSASDVLAAHDKGLMYLKDDKTGKWSLAEHEVIASFYVDDANDPIFAKLKRDSVYGEGTTLENMQTVLSSKDGFSVQGNVVEKTNPGSRLILRSFLSMLSAAAEEQTDYETALCEPADQRHVPYLESRPILKLKWSGSKQKLLPPLLAIDYRGQTYQITDPETQRVDELATWNRDIFRLLCELAGQASVDTSKFPLPTSLQVQPGL
jgi:hypothetical protein